jgi:hypothetical protein
MDVLAAKLESWLETPIHPSQNLVVAAVSKYAPVCTIPLFDVGSRRD